MEDLSEMCHVIQSRTHTAIAKASISVHTCKLHKISNVVENVFIFRSENIRDHLPATITSGLMTGIMCIAL